MRTQVAIIAGGPSGNSFTKVILPLETAWADADDALALDRVAVEFGDGEAKAAADECLGRWSALQRDTLQSTELYTRVRAAENTTAGGSIDRALATAWTRRMRLSGAGVDAGKVDEFIALRDEYARLQSDYDAVMNADPAFVTIGRRDLDGIPAGVLESGSRKRDGSYSLPVDERTQRLLEFASNESVRKTYWLAREHHAQAARRELFARIVEVRDHLAHLLGFFTWDDYRLAGSMAGDSARVDKVLHAVSDALSATCAAPWDASFDGPDALATAADFPVAHAVDGIVQTFAFLFKIRIERDAGDHAFPNGVIAYRVNDTMTDQPLGELLIRTDSRLAIQSQVNVLLGPRALNRPAVVLATVATVETANGEGFDHAQVSRAFGTLGDALATMLAATPYETLNLARPFDFGAILDQAFADLAWQPDILARVSMDAGGDPMDADRIAALLATRKDAERRALRTDVAAAQFDLAAHMSGGFMHWDAEAPVALDTLVHGGDGRTYASVWARLYATDVTAALARLRATVFAPAGSLDPNIELLRLLGRPANPAAFLQEFSQ